MKVINCLKCGKLLTVLNVKAGDQICDDCFQKKMVKIEKREQDDMV